MPNHTPRAPFERSPVAPVLRRDTVAGTPAV